MPFSSEYPCHVQHMLKMHCTGRITYFPDLLRDKSQRRTVKEHFGRAKIILSEKY